MYKVSFTKDERMLVEKGGQMFLRQTYPLNTIVDTYMDTYNLCWFVKCVTQHMMRTPLNQQDSSIHHFYWRMITVQQKPSLGRICLKTKGRNLRVMNHSKIRHINKNYKFWVWPLLLPNISETLIHLIWGHIR
jgi:hypothetical protein